MRWPPYIRSHDNVKTTFLDLKHEQIRVEAAFISLAKTCRYNGLLDGWYSNAEHSLLCCELAPTIRIARYCLIHDFGEYITGDMPGPIKTQCPDYKALCEQVQNFMYWHFLGTSANIPEEVDIIDKRLYATEQKYLRNAPDEDLNGLEPYSHVIFHQYERQEAYERLKAQFEALFPDYKDAI